MHTPGRFAGGPKSAAASSHPYKGRGPRTVRETSAGGVAVRVIDGEPNVAVIVRRNRTGRQELCLPKGHLERGETAAQAAVREIAEETGIDAKVVCQITTVDYWFSGSRSRVHKAVHHFLLDYEGGQITAEGDPDHEAEEARWVPLREATRALSYANERRVAEAALALLYPKEGRS